MRPGNIYYIEAIDAHIDELTAHYNIDGSGEDNVFVNDTDLSEGIEDNLGSEELRAFLKKCLKEIKTINFEIMFYN